MRRFARRISSLPIAPLVPGAFAVFAAFVLAGPSASASDTAGPTSAVPGRPAGRLPAGYAIVAFDSTSREWGAAAVSRWIAVGSRSLEARAGAGAWVSLGAPDPGLASIALDRMASGSWMPETLDSLLASDPRRSERQIAVVDHAGRAAVFSGDRLPEWAGERRGRASACQALAISGPEVLSVMERAFEGSRGSLGERLLAALEAAESIAMLRGQSAAILVVREGGGSELASDRLTDLRVDAAEEPLGDLKRIYALHASTFLPAAYARFGDEAKRRGDTISAERDYDRAEMGFRAGVAREPKNPDALNELAWFFATHDRNLEEAVRFAQAAVAARGNDPNLYDTLAEAEYRSGSLNRAIDAMERAVRYSSGAPRYMERLRRFRNERAALAGKAGTGTAQPPR